ncbi:MAG TPA: alpha-galactosidase [Acidobacteriaceae bacterium]|nr:alpha-galactosidase [Acidobacteriaceae bacterium]
MVCAGCALTGSRPTPSRNLRRAGEQHAVATLWLSGNTSVFGGIVNRLFAGITPVVLLGAALCASPYGATAQQSGLAVSIAANGDYTIGAPGATSPIVTASVAAKVDGAWIHSADYPHHAVNESNADGYLGGFHVWQIVFSGLAGKPDLACRVRAYTAEPFADVQVTVRNNTGKSVTVQSIRVLEASGGSIANLGGPAAADRVLSDSFSEDRPAMQIHDLGDAEHQMHRAVGSQLIYNRESRQSLFVGTLTSDRFLTILRLHLDRTGADPHIARYEVDSTGTTEMEEENSLQDSPAVDRVELSLPVPAGGELSSETLAIAAGMDYHRLLEAYGGLIRQIHHARVSAPPLMGWWSWTAYYFGLDEGAALTNAQWEAQHLKPFGYDLFHIDEGYQFARGEYVTANATVFPNGLAPMEYQIRGLGLTPGIWTAPFEVSERSAIFRDHRDWLVKNAQGQPIHAGSVVDGKDALYILDSTNPGAQEYLRDTYSRLVRQWDIHYIKMDFMDDSAIEGYYYKPHTTAMEAQRIGLQIIRDTVGDGVYLDKDGSAMLNPVGYVDYGRISQDTGHSFGASRDAATGIAARYFMDRNYFVSDPDAFTVSTQRISDQTWHEGAQPLTLEEAKVSIALAAVTGGMLEIGDNLPSLETTPDRVALLENRDLINMVRLGKASVPLDLMSYTAEDQQPSIFYLHESNRQSVLTVFNWTEHPTSHTLSLASLGLTAADQFTITNIFDGENLPAPAKGSLQIDLPAHAVRVLKIVDESVAATAPQITIDCPATGKSGDALAFSVHAEPESPVLSWRWDFGDGVQVDGAKVTHAWTEPGDYPIKVAATGLDDRQSEKTCSVHVTGYLSTVFAPTANRRYEPQ